MTRFSRLTLKNKIFISCLGVTLLVSLIIALFTRSLVISSLTRELKNRGVGIAQSIADSARGFILTDNRAELTSLAYDARYGNRKDLVKYLIISDTTGDILAHTFTTGFAGPIQAIVKQQAVSDVSIQHLEMGHHRVFHITVPVTEGIYRVGSIQMGLDKQHIDHLIAKLRWMFLSFLSMVTLIFFFLSHRLALFITRPIASLIRYTDRLTQGDFDIIDSPGFQSLKQALKTRNDEVSKLTDSFIKMTARLRNSTRGLKESQKKYRSLFKSGPNPIFVVDKTGFDILDANPNATKLFGYTRRELVKMTLFDLGELDTASVTGKPLDLETLVTRSKVRFFKKNGDPVFVNIHASPAEHAKEDVIIVGTTDITELVEKDSQLIQASKMANLEKMSAGIAHEINQPLNAIKMGSEYLCLMHEKKQAVPPKDLNLVLGEISSQVTRAAEIVSRLKTFSRKVDFSREVVDVNACIVSVHRIIGRQIALQNIDLVLDLDKTIAPVLAHGNRLEQVFFNLITNARDAINERIETLNVTDPGKIVIKTFPVNHQVGIDIEDNGAGIDPNIFESIFESFYTTKPMGEGLGLGLPIIRGIVKDYNGTITVSSRPGKGTVFTILFPASTDAPLTKELNTP
ncbi:MAG: PAS domain S-box protein [Desulfobacteraceae bacterium]|nr:PAS domain S-box protein [Desulfobacteraceae bacterium]